MSKLEENKVAVRYAKALFDGACEAGAVEVIERELIQADETFQKTPELLKFLANPAVPLQERMDFAEKNIASKVNPWVGNLVRMMVENHRIQVFSRVVNHFCLLINKRDRVIDGSFVGKLEQLRKQISV